jgi:hypothetical protein
VREYAPVEGCITTLQGLRFGRQDNEEHESKGNVLRKKSVEGCD